METSSQRHLAHFSEFNGNSGLNMSVNTPPHLGPRVIFAHKQAAFPIAMILTLAFPNSKPRRITESFPDSHSMWHCRSYRKKSCEFQDEKCDRGGINVLWGRITREKERKKWAQRFWFKIRLGVSMRVPVYVTRDNIDTMKTQ